MLGQIPFFKLYEDLKKQLVSNCDTIINCVIEISINNVNYDGKTRKKSQLKKEIKEN